jgi:glycosyltransferase involved in cell wall biosynthesis
VFVGHYLRDFETFRRAVRELVTRQPDVRVVVVTRPSFVRQFEGLPGTEIRIEPGDEELRLLYRRSSALLLPLEDAVANNTILEAMACGLPVVTTDVGAVRDYVAPEAGVVVPPGDAAALARAAADLLADRDRAARASAAARRAAVERFDLRAVASRVRAVLQEAASRPTASASRCCPAPASLSLRPGRRTIRKNGWTPHSRCRPREPHLDPRGRRTTPGGHQGA